MPIIPVHSFDDPQLSDFRVVADHDALRERGLFVAESRLVVRALLGNPRFRTRALLLTSASLDNVAPHLAAHGPDVPVYVGSAALMAGVVGYNVHRGCLALAERADEASEDGWVESARGARLAVVLEDVGNPDNIGGVFRNAAAFGAPLVLLSPRCGDPLYRKAVRVSIGATLRVEYAVIADWPAGLERLRSAGVSIVALTPASPAVDIADFAARAPERVALLLGAEGSGLSAEALRLADVRVRIPMTPGTDSLNVATAAAVALHRLARMRT